MTFGKLGGDPIQFISRPYEEVLYGIAVTHMPRYLINMKLGKGETIFDKIGIPYEELRKEDREILQLQEQIRQLLDSEGQRQFDRYEDWLNCRMTSELDQAYLVGYQTAIRLLLMGILPADTLLARNARHEPEEEEEKT